MFDGILCEYSLFRWNIGCRDMDTDDGRMGVDLGGRRIIKKDFDVTLGATGGILSEVDGNGVLVFNTRSLDKSTMTEEPPVEGGIVR